MKAISVIIAAQALLLYFAPFLKGEALDNWQKRNPNPQIDSLTDIVYGNGNFVTVGRAGAIATSTDSVNWTIQPAGISQNLNSVAYGNSLFIAVGDNGTILTSVNGVTWLMQVSGTSQNLKGVVCKNGIFCAVGDGGSVLISGDGATWQNCTSGVSTTLNGVAYGNGLFVAVGGKTVLTSSDGISWVGQNAGSTIDLTAVTFNAGIFVAVGSGLSAIISSENGVTWTDRTVSLNNHFFRRVTYGDGKFIAVGRFSYHSDVYGIVWTSEDGVIWNGMTLGDLQSLSGVADGNGTFVIVGSYGITRPNGVIWTSVTTDSWTSQGTGVYNGFGRIIYQNGLFVSIGMYGSILTSRDAKKWTACPSVTDKYLSGIAYGNDRFVAIADSPNSLSLVSQNGLTWVSQSIGTDDTISGIAYGSQMFVTVSWSGTIRTSSDGLSWTTRNSGTSELLLNIIYANGMFVAVGRGIILTSTDGINWTTHSVGISSALNDVAYGEGIFVAVGDSGKVFSSPDATDWTSRNSGTSVNLSGVTYGYGEFVAVGAVSGNSTVIRSSRDGITWRSRNSGISQRLNSVIAGGGTFVSVGDSGTILQSDNLVFENLFLTSGPGNVPTPFNPLPSYPLMSSRQPGKDSLVIITHGFQLLGTLDEVRWLDAMKSSIETQVGNNWQVEDYKWQQDAIHIGNVLTKAENHGRQLGAIISKGNWGHVHLIGHSAGAALIQAASETIKRSAPNTIVHTTFLDAYSGVVYGGRTKYGKGANWSDSYISRDYTGTLTEESLQYAYNVNVTGLSIDAIDVPVSGNCGLTICGFQKYVPSPIADPIRGHAWPHFFYQMTIEDSTFAPNYGYARSKEGGGWDLRANYVLGDSPIPLGESSSWPQQLVPVQDYNTFNFPSQPFVSSATGNVNVNDTGFNFTSGSPVWLSIGISVTNAVNFLSFESQFTSPPNAAGLLTVYWNTNQIGYIDEKYVLTGLQSYTLELPTTYYAGDFVLGFRIDPFTNVTSKAIITNVSLGFAGLPQPPSLDLKSNPTNRSRILNLNGLAGFNYLVEASSNLDTWIPVAVLVNTNGRVQFIDSATNLSQRFYRATVP